MTKFISRLKDLSDKLKMGASTKLESTPEVENQIQQEVKPETANGRLQPSTYEEKTTQPIATLETENQQDRLDKPIAEDGEVEELPEVSRRSPLLLKKLYIDKIPQFWQQINTPKPLYRRYSFWISLGLGSSAIALGGIWWKLEKSLPASVDEVLTYVRDGTLTIKTKDGTILQQTGPATREKQKIDEIPPRLVKAFIAIEDNRFYKHKGVDYRGILRAGVSNLQAGNVVEGGSTLTQQLARIVYLDQERSFWRKLKEIRLAHKIEEKITKKQILQRYLDLVYLGSGAYGVADAAWVYFSKQLDELTLPEIATIAGLPPAPSLYSPFVNPKAAKERRDTVLQEMRQAGYITPKEAAEAIASPLVTNRSRPKRLYREAPYFTDYIQQELPKYISSQVLEEGGLTVETTLNPKWQKVAEEVIKNTIKNNGKDQNFEQASLVAIEPRTGEIKAMVGGKDFYENQFNRVTQAKRQPGSTFKMFVYSTAIAGGFTPYRGYLDAPYTVDGYTPKNFSENHNGWLSMRDALTSSINVVAVKVLIDVGWDPVIQLAHKMGIESELKRTYSLALGASEVNLLELTSAYGTLANKGLHTKSHGISRILDRRGKVIYQSKFNSERALDEETSAIMSWMLRNVVNNGTGRPAQLDDRPVAGKTGTSDEARDLWFVGYIPQMVAGVWLGNDNNNPTWGASGTAAAAWRNFMAKVVEEMPVEKFPDRPAQLEGRKAQIKVQPLNAKRIFSGRVDTDENPDDDNNSTTNSYRRRRRVVEAPSSESSTPERTYRRRRRVVEAPSSESSTPERTYRRRRVESSEEAPRSRSRRRVVRRENSAPAEGRSRRYSRSRRSEAPANRESFNTPPAPRASKREVELPPAPPAARKSSSGE